MQNCALELDSLQHQRAVLTPILRDQIETAWRAFGKWPYGNDPESTMTGYGAVEGKLFSTSHNLQPVYLSRSLQTELEPLQLRLKYFLEEMEAEVFERKLGHASTTVIANGVAFLPGPQFESK